MKALLSGKGAAEARGGMGREEGLAGGEHTHTEHLLRAGTVLSALQTFLETWPYEMGIISISVLQTRKQVGEVN